MKVVIIRFGGSGLVIPNIELKRCMLRHALQLYFRPFLIINAAAEITARAGSLPFLVHSLV